MNLATQVAFLLNRALRAFQGQNRACLSFMIGMATSIPTGERIFITANGLKFSLFPGGLYIGGPSPVAIRSTLQHNEGHRLFLIVKFAG